MSRVLAYSLRDALCGELVRQQGFYSSYGQIKTCLANRAFRALVSLRLCQAAASAYRPVRALLLPFCRIFHRINCRRAGVDLSWQARLAPGGAITHGWGLVVSPGATIGRNCTLFHGVTIGRGDRIYEDGTRTSGFPVVEDEVWIGPHAIVVGGVTIGRGSRVLGGAFVTTDVPPNSLVIGNPASVIRSNIVPDVVNPA